MRKLIFLIVGMFLLLTSCTIYTEKQSEAVSQNVYAANESLNKARVDLAYFYSNETTKFIKPPKHPIKINAVYEAGEVSKDPKQGPKTRVVIVPDQYKNDKVVVVGSAEYQKLLTDREIKKQLEQDNKNKDNQLKANEKELTKQKEMSDKMVKDLNFYQKEVYKLRLHNLWLSIIILTLLVSIGGYFYIKANGMFFL
jgi:hypothetical protein